MQTIVTRHGEGKLATKVFVSSEAGFNVTSTIVMGKKECILIDCQWTRANAHRVIAEILETGLELKAIFATHAHPDHYWGMGEIADAFPNAKCYAPAPVVTLYAHQYQPKLDEWTEIIGEQIVKIAMPPPHDFGRDFVVSGVPHKIIPVDNLSKADVVGEGRRIRLSEAFAPDGTNVDFVTWRAPHRLQIRTYERGVEAETGACGTGAVAASVVGVADYGLEFPVHVTTVTGYELVVDGSYDGTEFTSITLTGPVKRVFEGVIDWDALDMVSE